MAWGGGGMGGGGAIGGGAIGGGGMFGAPQPGGHPSSPGAGLPFAGIPSELAERVEKLVANEPEVPEPEIEFSHVMPLQEPLNMRRLVAPYLRPVLFICGLVIVETVSLQTGPKLTQIGIDRGIARGNFGVVVVAALAFAGAVVLTGLSTGWRVAWTGRISSRIMSDLRVRVFSHLQRLSLDFYTDEKAGVIMTRMTSDIEALQQLFQDGLVQFAIQGLTMLVVAAVLLSMNLRLALITLLLVVPVLAGLSLWFRAASERGYNRVRDGIANVLSDLSESLSGMRIIHATNRQLQNTIHHRNVVGEYQDANNYTAHISAVYGPGTEFIGAVGQAILLFIGGRMVLHHQLTIGALTAFILYLNSFFAPIQTLVQLYNTYQQGQAAVVKLRELLQTTPSVPESRDAFELPPIEGEVRLQDVAFGYDPSQPVLSDINLTIAAGETFSLVGPTGAGKSTIAKLVARFYDPTEGRVLVDGYDLRHVTIESLRRQLGVVPQEPYLFSGTMRDNIAFARPDATDSEVMEAVHRVGLTELIERLPDGMDTIVHERGSSLASGERQLLVLA